jgi:ABC-2 type transport system ATP-binding protein
VLVYLGSLSKLSGRRLEDRVEKVLDLAGLQNEANRSVKGFSKGMMLRLGIAQAILHQPELLILDEPTDGLDPLGKKIVRTLLSDLSRAGTTILINSHLLSEIELVANRIAILHKGTVVTQGKLTDLLPKSQGFEVALSRNPGLTEPWVFRQRGASWLCEVEGRDLQKLLSVLGRNRIDIEAVQPLRTTLEDFFLHYVAETSHASSSDLSTSNP